MSVNALLRPPLSIAGQKFEAASIFEKPNRRPLRHL